MEPKITRRSFFKSALQATKKPFINNDFPYVFQGVKYKLTRPDTNKNHILFLSIKHPEIYLKKSMSTVSFSVFPHKKTDIFFDGLLEEQKITPSKRYILVNNMPQNPTKYWDKIVWISSEIPEILPDINCPILIIQDIENFDPTRSPNELLQFLHPESDIFIAQKLDLSDKNNPAMKRVYDFLNS